jgi:hypothetical protein
MSKTIDFTGQWVGFFSYGPEYGEEFAREKVEFRIFIDDFNEGEFAGRAVDLEGFGASYEIAQVKGYVDGDFISFTKEYPHYYYMDEARNTFEDKTKSIPL